MQVDMRPKTSIKVVIVGAGMGGLGTALAVVNAGHKAIVLEQAPEFVEVCRRTGNRGEQQGTQEEGGKFIYQTYSLYIWISC
jgi:cation diffusion facilitator CzcD-associated flavoprotein CzcO